MQEALQVNVPTAELKIKIALSIRFRGSGLKGYFLRRCFLYHARVSRTPVHLPGLAAIVGECLFKVTGIRTDVHPDISHQNASAIKGFLVEEFAPPILELADRRHAGQGAPFAVGIREAPLAGSGIV